LLCPLRSFTLETSIAVFQGRLAALKGGAEKNQNAWLRFLALRLDISEPWPNSKSWLKHC